MLNSIKNFLFNKEREKTLRRIHQLQSNQLSKKPHIGVIAELSEQAQLEQLIAFYKEQVWLQNPCNTLLYIDSKSFDLPFEFQYYTHKNVNWYNTPDFEKIKSFIGTPYEKLIVLNPQHRKHIHFLPSVCKTGITCGLASYDAFRSYYQLMVELKDASNYKNAIDEIYAHYEKLI